MKIKLTKNTVKSWDGVGLVKSVFNNDTHVMKKCYSMIFAIKVAISHKIETGKEKSFL